MNRYTLIAGVNGTGKSSLRGVLEGQAILLGHIIDADYIAKKHGFDVIQAGKQAIREINQCLEKNISFTQETTLAGKRVEKTILQARKQGYYISLFYLGLDSMEESLRRIENRVRKGGHSIPPEDVRRRYESRYEALGRVLPYCDEVVFYDNENGFVKVAEMRNNHFYFCNGYRPKWLEELKDALSL
jgi:predicted ABC-type ATPase